MKELTLEYLLICMAVMMGVTYGLRMVSLVLFRKKLNGKFIFSFLTYTPYGVLATMIFPDIFLFNQSSSTFSLPEFVCAAAGAAVALVLSVKKKGLTTVSLCAVLTIFVIQQIFTYIL